NIGTTVT
ncbi:hypothetical protein MK338_10050, partial [Streptococcus vestibularis]|nr:hypothetical protein [Streptococcus vestibularis]